MASNKFIVFAILAIFIPSVAMATKFIVGDDKGWGLGVDYTQWVAGKTFRVGDILVFNYNASRHNLLKVDGPAFKDCITNGNPLITGKDEITIKDSGKKWYICAVADHCKQGQKLVITVQSDAPAPTPTAPAPNSGHGLIPTSMFQIFAGVAIGLAFLMQ